MIGAEHRTISLAATLNAYDFYRKQEFIEADRYTLVSASGAKLPVIQMVLSASPAESSSNDVHAAPTALASDTKRQSQGI